MHELSIAMSIVEMATEDGGKEAQDSLDNVIDAQVARPCCGVIHLENVRPVWGMGWMMGRGLFRTCQPHLGR